MRQKFAYLDAILVYRMAPVITIVIAAMEEIINNPILTAVLGGIIGLLLGIGLMTLLQRKQTGGRSVEQMRKEMEDYREKVSDHFATTSDLFRDMTDKYRDVYNHLAASSQALCEDPMEHGRLEFTHAKAVTNDEVAEVEKAPSVEPEVEQATIEEADEVAIDPSELKS